MIFGINRLTWQKIFHSNITFVSLNVCLFFTRDYKRFYYSIFYIRSRMMLLTFLFICSIVCLFYASNDSHENRQRNEDGKIYEEREE